VSSLRHDKPCVSPVTQRYIFVLPVIRHNARGHSTFAVPSK